MIQISTSVGCKVNCSYCPQSPHIKAYKDTVKGTGPYQMSLETFKTCIDKIPPKHPVHLFKKVIIIPPKVCSGLHAEA